VKVKKRNGKLEDFNPDKITQVVEWACNGIKNVSASDVCMNAQLSISDKIRTEDIHDVLIQSAYNLISEENPNYQYVASKLRNFALRKEVWGECDPPRLYDHIKRNRRNYDSIILEYYSESEIHKINRFIKHDRDFDFTHAGIQQMIDKYLIADKKTGKIFETPQFVYILIPMILFKDYENRMSMIKQAYNMLSQFKINLPTPILAGVRTKMRYYASCVLADCGDSLDSIFTTAAVIGKYTARRSGIGINMGRVRAIGSPIRDSEVISTGIIPFLKVMESTVKSTSQNGLRGGGATVSVPWWHYEIEDVIVLKNNAGTDDNRVRKLDYCIQLEKVFYERIKNDEEITLFCPHQAEALYEAFGTPSFEALYEEFESKAGILKKQIRARDLIALLAKERLETGRIYIMNIDKANESPWIDTVQMTNLCCEILQPVRPLQSIHDQHGEIGVCILSAVNLLQVKDDELENVCRMIVYILNEVIDYQEYPFTAAANFCKRKRSLGVGVTNFAAWLASQKLNHESPDAVAAMNDLCERLQYYLLSASCEMAETHGAADDFNSVDYSLGVLPTDRDLVPEDIAFSYKMDWEKLRERIKNYGLRNCTVTAQMPCESSSICQSSTNGIEPIRSFLTEKTAKNGIKKVLIPNYPRYKNEYAIAWDITSNANMIKIAAAMQRWFDMGISFNTYLNYQHYPDGKIPRSVVIKDIMLAYKYGLRTMYYNNTPDDSAEAHESDRCESGACSI